MIVEMGATDFYLHLIQQMRMQGKTIREDVLVAINLARNSSRCIGLEKRSITNAVEK